jgi:SsrA-binding protein
MPAETILNRKALRDFHILERFEAGVELKGSEVKSIRAGKANISDAFARIEKGEAFLYGADIQPYAQASHEPPPPKRVLALAARRAEQVQCAGIARVFPQHRLEDVDGDLVVAPAQGRSRRVDAPL